MTAVALNSKLWVPSVDEWSRMSWYQRRLFVEDRRPVVVQKLRVRCERRHAGDVVERPPVPEPISEANRLVPPRFFTADELHHLAELRRIMATPTSWSDEEVAAHRKVIEDGLWSGHYAVSR